MTLARMWKRQLLGASGAAVLMPGAIAAALIALVFAGGFGEIRSLGQVFSGPAVPAWPAVAPAAAAGSRAPLDRLLAAAGSATARPAVRSTRRTSGARPRTALGGSAPRHTTAPSGSSGGSGPITGGSTGSPGSSSNAGAGGSGGTGSPPPTPPPPTAVDKVVGAATSVTQQIPGPVGAVATDTLTAVGATVDRTIGLPHLPGG